MPSGSAQKILEIFAYFEGRPSSLLANHFLAVGRRRGWDAGELQEAIEAAHHKGWIEPAELGWRLTRAGSAEAAKMQHA